MKKLLLICLTLSFIEMLFAQNEVPDLITDRPYQTESSSIVPHRSLQIETGFVLANSDETTSYAYNTTLLRYGLIQQLELRLGMDYLAEKNNKLNVDESGLSPIYTGFKVFISPEKDWKPEIAFLGALIIPITAAEYFEPKHTAASMRFTFSHTLSERFSLGYNLGAEWDGDTSIPAYFYSLVLGISLTEQLGIYLETFGTIQKYDLSEVLCDGGFTYLLSNNFQIDLSAGLGLSKSALDNYFSIGLTWRVPQ